MFSLPSETSAYTSPHPMALLDVRDCAWFLHRSKQMRSSGRKTPPPQLFDKNRSGNLPSPG